MSEDRTRAIIKKTVIYLFLIVGAFIMILPFYWMLISSVKTRPEMVTYPPTFITLTPTLEWYKELFALLPMGRYYFNSIVMAGLITLGSLFLCSLAGYAFAKHKFYGQNVIFMVILGTMMIPWQVNIIPGFMIVKHLGWLNSFKGLIIPALASPFGIFFLRQYIRGIPDELIDAAKIDGCNEWGVYWHIILPNSRPVLATLGIFIFIGQWNNFIWPLLIIHKSDMMTIPLALSVLNGQFANKFGIIMAGTVCAVIPVLIVFLTFQKWITKSIVISGIK